MLCMNDDVFVKLPSGRRVNWREVAIIEEFVPETIEYVEMRDGDLFTRPPKPPSKIASPVPAKLRVKFTNGGTHQFNGSDAEILYDRIKARSET